MVHVSFCDGLIERKYRKLKWYKYWFMEHLSRFKLPTHVTFCHALVFRTAAESVYLGWVWVLGFGLNRCQGFFFSSDTWQAIGGMHLTRSWNLETSERTIESQMPDWHLERCNTWEGKWWDFFGSSQKWFVKSIRLRSTSPPFHHMQVLYAPSTILSIQLFAQAYSLFLHYEYLEFFLGSMSDLCCYQSWACTVANVSLVVPTAMFILCLSYIIYSRAIFWQTSTTSSLQPVAARVISAGIRGSEERRCESLDLHNVGYGDKSRRWEPAMHLVIIIRLLGISKRNNETIPVCLVVRASSMVGYKKQVSSASLNQATNEKIRAHILLANG